MTLISTLHNVSRSVGCALLATGDGRLVAVFVGGELMLYITYKLFRGEYYYWVRINGVLGMLMGFLLV